MCGLALLAARVAEATGRLESGVSGRLLARLDVAATVIVVVAIAAAARPFVAAYLDRRNRPSYAAYVRRVARSHVRPVDPDRRRQRGDGRPRRPARASCCSRRSCSAIRGHRRRYRGSGSGWCCSSSPPRCSCCPRSAGSPACCSAGEADARRCRGARALDRRPAGRCLIDGASPAKRFDKVGPRAQHRGLPTLSSSRIGPRLTLRMTGAFALAAVLSAGASRPRAAEAAPAAKGSAEAPEQDRSQEKSTDRADKAASEETARSHRNRAGWPRPSGATRPPSANTGGPTS